MAYAAKLSMKKFTSIQPNKLLMFFRSIIHPLKYYFAKNINDVTSAITIKAFFYPDTDIVNFDDKCPIKGPESDEKIVSVLSLNWVGNLTSFLIKKDVVKDDIYS